MEQSMLTRIWSVGRSVLFLLLHIHEKHTPTHTHVILHSVFVLCIKKEGTSEIELLCTVWIFLELHTNMDGPAKCRHLQTLAYYHWSR